MEPSAFKIKEMNGELLPITSFIFKLIITNIL